MEPMLMMAVSVFLYRGRSLGREGLSLPRVRWGGSRTLYHCAIRSGGVGNILARCRGKFAGELYMCGHFPFCLNNNKSGLSFHRPDYQNPIHSDGFSDFPSLLLSLMCA